MVCCPQCPLPTTAGHRLPAKGASCTFWGDDSPVLHREGFTALPANQGQEQTSQRHWEHCLPCSWASMKHQIGNQSPAHTWRCLNTHISGFVWLHGKLPMYFSWLQECHKIITAKKDTSEKSSVICGRSQVSPVTPVPVGQWICTNTHWEHKQVLLVFRDIASKGALDFGMCWQNMWG